MPNELQFVLYSIDQEDIKVKVAIKDETIWVTQRGMAELFDVNVSAVSKHLANIYSEGELSQTATVSKMEIVQTEGTRQVTRLIDFYNLDAVISVGYRGLSDVGSGADGKVGVEIQTYFPQKLSATGT